MFSPVEAINGNIVIYGETNESFAIHDTFNKMPTAYHRAAAVTISTDAAEDLLFA